MRLWVTLVVLTLVFGVGAGCRSTTGESFGTNLDDTKITSEVKRKLTADRIGNLTRVNVTTNAGTVSLTGNVPSAEDRTRAEQVARSVNGVQQVTNNLQVQKQ